MENMLLLGSVSQSRQQLLTDAGISFKCVKQDANEARCDWGLPLQQLVEHIALYKMEHVILPNGTEGEQCYVLTADTVTEDASKKIHGKPVDREDELEKIRVLRHGVRVGTGFCLDLKKYHEGTWQTEERLVRFGSAECVFDVPDVWIEQYMKSGQGIGASGGMRIEGYGSLFLKSISGSCSAVVGLPMFELREALEKLNFFEF